MAALGFSELFIVEDNVEDKYDVEIALLNIFGQSRIIL